METDISPLTHKMHSHMEDDKAGGAPGGYKLLRECGQHSQYQPGVTHLRFFLLSCDTDLMICEGVHAHKSDIILDRMGEKIEVEAETAEARLSLLSSSKKKNIFFV